MGPTRRTFAVCLIAGALLRAAALPLPGTGDVGVWKIWAFAASQHGVLGMYGVGGTPTERRLHEYDGGAVTVDYPPLTLALLAGVGHAYRAITGGFANTPALTAAVKSLVFAADAIITLLIVVGVGRAAPGRPGVARLAGLAYWLNPAALMNGAVLGYLDPLMGAPVVAATVAAAGGLPAAAGACLALAVLTKPQAVILAPVIAVAVLNAAAPGTRARAALRAGAAGAVVVAVALIPFLLAGAGPNFVQAMASLGRHNTLSANAANAWWIVTWIMRGAYAVADLGWYDAFVLPVRRPLMITRVVELGYPNPRAFASAVVLAAVAWALWRHRRARDLATVSALGAWTVVAYFVLGIAVHENHGYLAVPLLVMAAALAPEWRTLACWLSVTTALNLNLFYGFGDRIGFALPRGLTGLDATVWLAALHVALLAAFARRLARTPAAGST